MVYGIVIHTVAGKDAQVLYYKIFTCFGSGRRSASCTEESISQTNPSEEEEATGKDGTTRYSDYEQSSKVLFESVSEKKELVNYMCNKVYMRYSLKIKQTLISINSVKYNTKITGIFKERQWKDCTDEIVVVWQGVRGLCFTLLCKKDENIYQAQTILDHIITQCEMQIKLLSDPLIAVKLVEIISLIVNNYLPGGQLIYMNSKMLKYFERKVELDLYAK